MSARDDLRKGWCPGALRPMATRDGLLVRLRITGGILPAAKARAIADLATRFGNGLFDLSARANLQIRGVAEADLPALWDGLSALDLLDGDIGAESVRNVIASPLAGLHEGLDIRPLIVALEDRLTADTRLHALPSKFGFLVDDGGTPSLADVAADIRFDWSEDDAAFSIGLAGTRSDAERIGRCRADELVEIAARLVEGAVRLFRAQPEAKRMRGLVARLGAKTVADAAGLAPLPPIHLPTGPAGAKIVVGVQTFGGLTTIGLAAPYGGLTATMLAAAANRAGQGDLRLTPWRVLLVPIADGVSTPAPAGFITDPRDPRLAVAACIGIEGCDRGTTTTRDDATALANLAAALDEPMPLHVSGCEKGCAKPSASAITLVGRAGRYDLVRDGRASDTPVLRGLTLIDARRALVAMSAGA